MRLRVEVGEMGEWDQKAKIRNKIKFIVIATCIHI